MSRDEPRDWTEGGSALTYQHCPDCHAIWYFRRAFCPRCGGGHPEIRPASGSGHVHAITEVARAPAEVFKPHAPYQAALVDAEEGFRFLAHAEPGLAIGEAVVSETRLIAGAPVPFVRRR